MNTQLLDRVLWFDGTYSVPSNKLNSFLKRKDSGSLPCVDELTSDIKKFNKLMPASDRIYVKQQNREFDYHWDIPNLYKDMDVQTFVLNKFIDECDGLSDKDIDLRQVRVMKELKLFKKKKLLHILKTLIFIVDKFEEHDEVWGIGRGSSVSSYVLYLIGIHDVDSVEYGLNLLEFFKTN